MLTYRCICCRREYKKEYSPKALTTHGICGAYCRQSFDLWLGLPPVLRNSLQVFHSNRARLAVVA